MKNFLKMFTIGVVLFCLGMSSQAVKTETAEEVAVLETDLGEIVIGFYPQEAPKTVENFKKLIREGFYDGTYFHRVIPGFMVQGGDPNTKDDSRANDGMGGPGYKIAAEFNEHSHVKGAVSMARSAHPDSAGSQFFICVEQTPHLDGQYTVFGVTLKGMDVVDKIVKSPRDRRDNPLKSITISKASLKEKEDALNPKKEKKSDVEEKPASKETQVK